MIPLKISHATCPSLYRLFLTRAGFISDYNPTLKTPPFHIGATYTIKLPAANSADSNTAFIRLLPNILYANSSVLYLFQMVT